MASTGRNDTCPCGSGKKYKNCHWKEDQFKNIPKTELPKPIPFDTLIDTYNYLPILKFLASLQLNGLNHGHEDFFEKLSRKVLLKRTKTKTFPFASWQKLQEVFKDFTLHSDEPTSFFTENIVFTEGNHTVYPGLSITTSKVINDLFDVMYVRDNKLPAEFKKDVHDGAALILLLSEAIASKKNHERYLDEKAKNSKIEIGTRDEVAYDAAYITFSKELILQVCKQYKYDHKILSQFVLEETDESLKEDDPDLNPVIKKPLIETEDEIIVFMPSTILNSLMEFIYSNAIKYDCLESLIGLLTEYQFLKVGKALSEMEWIFTNIELPRIPATLPIREHVFQIDNNKFGYVCFVNDVSTIDFSKEKNGIHQRALQVIKYLEKINPKADYSVLTLFILADTGVEGHFAWNAVPSPHLCTSFSYSDLIAISLTEKRDPLIFWKFTKAYNYAQTKTKVLAMGGTLDIYSIYESNNGSLFPSDEILPSGMLMIVPGSGNQYKKKIIKLKDEHGVAVFTGKMKGFTKVIREKEYAPIYTDTFVDKQYRRVVENFRMPIWITNYQNNSGANKDWGLHACEAIAFWFQKLEKCLQPILDKISLIQFEIEIVVDENLLKGGDFEIKEFDLNSIEIKKEIVLPRIQLFIPFDFIYLVQLPDNKADKVLMKAALEGMQAYIQKSGKESALTSESINEMVDKFLEPANAKMLLFVDVSRNVRMDNRDLQTLRYIQEYDISFVLENLVSYLPTGYVIAQDIPNLPTKVKLCHDIVGALVKQIELRLAEFDGNDLLRWLIRKNEKCIQAREFQEIQIPAKIACYSSFESEVARLHGKEENLVSTALSTRTLIEWVAAKVPSGKKWANIDDIDKLLAFTNLIINWGASAEALDFEFSNPKIGILPSGRIGTEKILEKEVLEPYAELRTQNDVYSYIEKFEENYQPVFKDKEQPQSKEAKVLDDAFYQETGIKLSTLSKFVGSLMNYGFQEGKSCCQISKPELIEIVKRSAPEIENNDIDICLSILTLISRNSIGRPPEGQGFNNKDIFPWRYTRPLSYLRRPIVNNDTEGYLFGFRHLSAYFENLGFLLLTGKYPEAKSKALGSWLAQTLSEKGKPFRNEVRDWLKKNTTYEVINYEVSINKNGHLDADKNYGDIDILSFDHAKKIVYSIECKSSTGGRNIHEMKSEIDLYLGKDADDKKAKIRLHANRDKWLNENQNSLSKFLEHPNDYRIISFILSAEQLPVKFLKKDKLPLPIKSFASLKRNGIKEFEDLF